ncbi:class IV lanthionine synthetase LanL [Rhodococcus erythropolis]|uniref:class IV lanthionine synthetase LanL n=1 Tax=Rhodococcus erythropolis TaxID=1833 RepID=UPI0024B72F2B|nr:class IV lanthionine synthetase LanL [Rhodococcus erythropolis]MDJ0015056.1 class IV lanthionine synthetase LanL [Rhodococcus erythropolis]
MTIKGVKSWDHHDLQLPNAEKFNALGWLVETDPFWRRVTPPCYFMRPQGWKLHISSSMRDSAEVLAVATGVLLQHRVAFKYTKGTEQLSELLSHRQDRGSGCKFMTIYPESATSNEDIHKLATTLDEALNGFEGPRILSDLILRENSLVHARYGVISGSRPHLKSDGAFEIEMTSPEGDYAMDERLAWFSPPVWAQSPFPIAQSVSDASDVEPMLNGNYSVTSAVRHSNRGGVYRARDRNGRLCILKEARPFIGPQPDGSTMVDQLRHEEEVLRAFAGTQVFPEPFDLFEEGGHLFLAEEELPGDDLRAYFAKEFDRGLRGDVATVVVEREKLCLQIIEKVSEIHAKDYVVGDLTPGNIMLTPGGEVRFIDAEFVAAIGCDTVNANTLGYAARERMRSAAIIRHLDPTSDIYALAMVLVFVLTEGVEPPICEADDEDAWFAATVKWIDTNAAENSAIRSRRELLTAMVASESSLRPSINDVLRCFDQPVPAEVVVGAVVAAQEAPTAIGLWLTTDLMLLGHSVKTRLAEGLSPVEPVKVGTGFTDPLAVQGGCAGTLVTLLDLANTPHWNQNVEFTARSIADYLARELTVSELRQTLPGTYFGRSGTALALRTAAHVFGDQEMRELSIRLLRAAPVEWGNPDVTHGIAGSGLVAADFVEQYGEKQLLPRLSGIANTMKRIVTVEDDATLAVQIDRPTHFGYAHGIAGFLHFFAAYGAVTGDRASQDIVDVGVRHLQRVAILSGDYANWPISQSSDEIVVWWCSGAGGIGSALTRLHSTSDTSGPLKLARMAAASCEIAESRLQSSHCHGIAGNAHLYLDLFARTGERHYLKLCEGAIERLQQKRYTDRDGVSSYSGDTGRTGGASFGLGDAGALSLLGRYLYGTPRPFYADSTTL